MMTSPAGTRVVSFRVRIALLALATSGLVLVAVGLSFLAVSSRVGLERLDREIRTVADSQLRSWHPADHWSDVDRSLAFIYGADGAGRPVLIVNDANGTRLFVTADAPPELIGLRWPTLAWLDDDPHPTATANPFVSRLDTDGDGRVSAAEFDGPVEQFPVFDTDKNGSIDEDEARRARDAHTGGPGPDVAPGIPPPLVQLRQKAAQFQTVTTARGDWRVGVFGNELVTLAVGLSLADTQRDAAQVRTTFLGATGLALLLLAAGGWLLATHALRPVATIIRMADTLRARDLHRRIPNDGADAEFRVLVDVLNGMIERLETSFRQAERFSADAAHELQTPLTVLQGELDTAIQRAPEGSDEQRTYGSALDEVRRLKSVVHKLLLLARADAGRLALSCVPVDVSAVAAEMIDDLQTLAPSARLQAAIEPGLVISTDRELLNQIVLNLASNAAKYTPDDGTIRVELNRTGDGLRLSVANSGDTIPDTERERVFDRFYRLDVSRARAAGGSGLGLSVARGLARALGGDVVLAPPEPGVNVFTLTLPASARLQ